MRDCPHGALLVLLIYVMVDEASDGLKDESSDNNDADNRMTIAGRQLSARSTISLRGHSNVGRLQQTHL